MRKASAIIKETATGDWRTTDYRLRRAPIRNSAGPAFRPHAGHPFQLHSGRDSKFTGHFRDRTWFVVVVCSAINEGRHSATAIPATRGSGR